MQVEQINQNVFRKAVKMFLPAGYKPEDYFVISAKMPHRIAKLIADEYLHIIKMNKPYKRRRKNIWFYLLGKN